MAHFNRNDVVQGRDCIEIQKIYITLSNVFLFCEIRTFIKVILEKLDKIGYTNFTLSYKENKDFDISQFSETINEFSRCKCFVLKCKGSNQQEYGLFLTKMDAKQALKIEIISGNK